MKVFFVYASDLFDAYCVLERLNPSLDKGPHPLIGSRGIRFIGGLKEQDIVLGVKWYFDPVKFIFRSSKLKEIVKVILGQGDLPQCHFNWQKNQSSILKRISYKSYARKARLARINVRRRASSLCENGSLKDKNVAYIKNFITIKKKGGRLCEKSYVDVQSSSKWTQNPKERHKGVAFPPSIKEIFFFSDQPASESLDHHLASVYHQLHEWASSKDMTNARKEEFGQTPP
uniref:Uncharacterized protein n=1 Tax=Cucumis melo TaxID=3656 RepID=A0A9I9EIY2_CUCME